MARSQFEDYVASRRFVEHGEFDRQLYGTTLDAIRTVINSGKASQHTELGEESLCEGIKKWAFC